MRQVCATLIFVAVFCISAHAQSSEYSTAIGLRLGNSSGISAKKALRGRTVLEGLVTTRWNGINVTALAEVALPLDTPGLRWYYGGGAHVGFWDHPDNPEREGQLFVGVDGIVGMEYTFSTIPLNLSLDWKPMFNILSYTSFNWDEFALSVRYVIN